MGNARAENWVEEAALLVEQADGILGEFLQPGRWSTEHAARRFLQGDDLQRVLSLYARAMEQDPIEPAYPWNLASSLDRLRLPDLALVFIRRAIRVAHEAGDDEWSGADAHLALADIAIRAKDLETAEIAIEQARRIDPATSYQRYLRRLRCELVLPAEDEVSHHEDAARKGVAVEHLIAASCMMSSGFELSVSTNLVDDMGVDLVFHRRQSSTMIAVQIKSRSWSANVMRKKARFVATFGRALSTRAATSTSYLSPLTCISQTMGRYGWFPALILRRSSALKGEQTSGSSPLRPRPPQTGGPTFASSVQNSQRASSTRWTDWNGTR